MIPDRHTSKMQICCELGKYNLGIPCVDDN